MRVSRLYGVDVLRALAFFALLINHLQYSVWGIMGYDGVAVASASHRVLEVFARTLDFSGFTIIFLSFFLFGFKPEISRKWKYLWALLLVFFLIWCAVSGDFPYVWDIYPFLLVAIPLLALARRLPVWALLLTGFTIVSIPFWRWEGTFDLPVWFERPLLGVCRFGDQYGDDWPLLPWIGYPIFSFGAGRWAYARRESLSKGSWVEAAIWVVLLLASLPYLGIYYVTPLGERFACYMFRQSPLVFWSHQLWIFWFLRLSLLRQVRDFMAGHRIFDWVSRRPYNRHFFLVYFLHYPFVLQWGDWARQYGFTFTGYSVTLGFVVTLALIETIFIVIRRLF